jgi:hypothetical protein
MGEDIGWLDHDNNGDCGSNANLAFSVPIGLILFAIHKIALLIFRTLFQARVAYRERGRRHLRPWQDLALFIT